MKYPKECPAFEIVTTKYSTTMIPGAIVEGTYEETDDGRPYICIYDNADSDGEFDYNWYAMGALDSGWGPNATLYPLTLAAREMLKLVADARR